MKKLFFTLALVLVTMTASAQLSFGLRGGLNVVSMGLNSEVFWAKNRAGWFVGPTIKFNLPILNLGIDGSVLYDQRTSALTLTDNVSGGDSPSTSITRQAINIPINLRYGIGLGEMAEIFLKAGPQIGFNVGKKNVVIAQDALGNKIEQEFAGSEFSVNVGLGFMLFKHLEIAANYNIVCGKTSDVSFSTILGSAADKSRSNAWQISAAYYF